MLLEKNFYESGFSDAKPCPLRYRSAAAGAQGKQLSFQPSEIDSIVEVLKIGKSPQEIQQIDRACALMRQFRAAGARGGSRQSGS